MGAVTENITATEAGSPDPFDVTIVVEPLADVQAVVTCDQPGAVRGTTSIRVTPVP